MNAKREINFGLKLFSFAPLSEDSIKRLHVKSGVLCCMINYICKLVWLQGYIDVISTLLIIDFNNFARTLRN